MTTLSNYWAACEAEVAALTKAKPRTATEVVAILRQYDPMNLGNYSEEAFFSAANAGESLLELLLEAGWAIDWIEADYHWQTSPRIPPSPSQHPETRRETRARPNRAGLEAQTVSNQQAC